MPNIVVRKYIAADRAAVRHISVMTAVTGRPAGLFFQGSDVLADVLTRYFTDYEPESCFVAVVNGVVAGYLIGAVDAKKMEKVFFRHLFWPLLGKVLRAGIFLKACNWRFFFRLLGAAIQGKFLVEDFSRDYPAALHINLLDEYRGTGLGTRLMESYLAYLKALNIRGVMMATMSDNALQFFARHGFCVLQRSTRPYFREVFARDVPYYLVGKKLE